MDAMAGTISETTRQGVLKVEWNIENFLSLEGTIGNCLISPEFRFSDTSWLLKIHPYREEEDALDTLPLDLKKLLESSARSDLTVRLKSKEYRAHSAILAARSDVFASALEHDMLEKESGVISIEDCDPDSFEEFLQYLYTGRADINESNVFHLFQTADKYLVGELKSHCVAFLMENLSVDNFCDAVALADDHNEDNLKWYCTYFFYDNFASIILTSNWQSLARSYSNVAIELLTKYVQELRYPR